MVAPPGISRTLTLSSSSSRVFLPLVLLLGLLAIVMGLFMAYSPSVRAQFIGFAGVRKRRVGSGLGRFRRSVGASGVEDLRCGSVTP